jgi:hypothetical protein
MSFQVNALPADSFQPLFAMTDEHLATVRASRMRVDTKPGFPCRISLADAEIGESVILLNFEHQQAESPFRSTHAIFVRENVEQAFPAAGMIPESIQSRLISIRGFDDKHFMINADVIDGSCLREMITDMFEDPKVAYLHLHYARPGCYAARVTRV